MVSPKLNKKPVNVGWAMLRVSTTGQAEVQHGSLEQQKNMVSRWAHLESEKSGSLYKIVRYIEEDVSGRSESLHLRPELLELQLAIENREIDFFVIEKVDRLTRSQIYNLQIMAKAAKFGVEVYEYESGLIDMKDRGKRLGFNIKNMMAEEYSLELEEKVTKKMREAMVSNGKDSSSIPVLGLECHPTMACIYVINSDEQKIDIDIFNKFAELGNLKALEHYCRSMGYKTKMRMTEKRIDRHGKIIPPRQIGGELFDSRTLRQLLGSHKLRGFSFFMDTWNQFPNLQNELGLVRWDYAHFKEHGPVVPLELFDKVQDILEVNKHKNTKSKTGGEVYLLSGILFKSDGGQLVGASAKSGNNHYYEDRKKKEYRIIKGEIEKVVCDRIAQYLHQAGLVESILRNIVNDKSDELLKIEDETKGLKVKVSELQTAIRRFGDYLRTAALDSDSKLDEVCKTINQERRRAEEELAMAISQLDRLEAKQKVLTEKFEEKTIREYLKGIFRDFEKKCSHQKKQLIHALIPKIIVHPDDRLEIVFNPFFRQIKNPEGNPSGFDSGEQKFGYGLNGWRSNQHPNFDSSIWYLTDFIPFRTRGPILSKDFLHQKYALERLSIGQIARTVSSSTSTVHKYLRLYDIPIRKGAACHLPTKGYGLAYGKRILNRRLIDHGREAEIIRKMKELRDKGFSYPKIADALNTMGVPTKTGRAKWCAKKVHQIIGPGAMSGDTTNLQ
jgi:DNA invertase Pin-like site-specific DNA recombinase